MLGSTAWWCSGHYPACGECVWNCGMSGGAGAGSIRATGQQADHGRAGRAGAEQLATKLLKEITSWYGGWLRNHQLIDGKQCKHPIILFGFQPSFWWCRISQPSTVSLGNYWNHLKSTFFPGQVGPLDDFDPNTGQYAHLPCKLAGSMSISLEKIFTTRMCFPCFPIFSHFFPP